MNRRRGEWTRERDAELARCWATGATASRIGLAMGLTKSAVIGRAHRLALPSRPSPIGRGRPSAALDGLTPQQKVERHRTMARERWRCIAASRAARAPVLPPAPPRPAPLPAVQGESLADQVARFTRQRGVTRCPAAALAETTATIPAGDAAAVRAYHDAAEAARRQEQVNRQASRSPASRSLSALRAKTTLRS